MYVSNPSFLQKKLHKYSINGSAHDWFASCLKDSKQQVDIDENLSTPHEATTVNIFVI